MAVGSFRSEFDVIAAVGVTAIATTDPGAGNERPSVSTSESAGESIRKSYLAIQAGSVEVGEELIGIVGVSNPGGLQLQN